MNAVSLLFLTTFRKNPSFCLTEERICGIITVENFCPKGTDEMEEIKLLSAEFKIREDLVGNIVKLIDDGNTIPFIARYRKEMTGSCDDQVLREFADRLQYLRNLQKRREEVCASIEEQGKLTEELKLAIDQAKTLSEVEDLYRTKQCNSFNLQNVQTYCG